MVRDASRIKNRESNKRMLINVCVLKKSINNWSI